MSKFFDTCALLDFAEDIFQNEDKFYISNITLKELENIKTSATKDDEVKSKARKVLKYLLDNKDKYEVIIYKNFYESYIKEYDYEINNDTKIIACAHDCDEQVIFVTTDISCKHIAESTGLITQYFQPKEDDYVGYKIIEAKTDEELANIYNNVIPLGSNPYMLLENEYLLLKYNDEIVDKYRWINNTYEQVITYKPTSQMFGIPHFKFDNLQQLALDSFKNNKITMIKGPAGSGKSCISFLYMFSLLEKGKIDKIIIFCNTVATKGSAKLGFYPGSRTEKLLDSQIGNFLISKLGDRFIVEKLIDEGKIMLLPVSDIRGFDTSGMNAAVYITEAQNLDTELIKLCLQRIGEDCICILDGDVLSQVDMNMYAGIHNGMRRVSKVFRGHDFYGEVTLDKIRRSEIAELAQEI